MVESLFLASSYSKDSCPNEIESFLTKKQIDTMQKSISKYFNISTPEISPSDSEDEAKNSKSILKQRLNKENHLKIQPRWLSEILNSIIIRPDLKLSSKFASDWIKYRVLNTSGKSLTADLVVLAANEQNLDTYLK